MMELPRILGLRRPDPRRLGAAAMLLSGLLLGGCGQRGPLFLPSATAATPAAAAPTASSPATTPDDAQTRG